MPSATHMQHKHVSQQYITLFYLNLHSKLITLLPFSAVLLTPAPSDHVDAAEELPKE